MVPKSCCEGHEVCLENCCASSVLQLPSLGYWLLRVELAGWKRSQSLLALVRVVLQTHSHRRLRTVREHPPR